MRLTFLCFLLFTPSLVACLAVYGVAWEGNQLIAGVFDAKGNFSALGVIGSLGGSIGAVGLSTFDYSTNTLFVSGSGNQTVSAQLVPSFKIGRTINLDEPLAGLSFDEKKGRLIMLLSSTGGGNISVVSRSSSYAFQLSSKVPLGASAYDPKQSLLYTVSSSLMGGTSSLFKIKLDQFVFHRRVSSVALPCALANPVQMWMQPETDSLWVLSQIFDPSVGSMFYSVTSVNVKKASCSSPVRLPSVESVFNSGPFFGFSDSVSFISANNSYVPPMFLSFFNLTTGALSSVQIEPRAFLDIVTTNEE